MEFKKIVEFEVGEDIQGYYLIRSATIKSTANNKKYLDITMMDGTGEINGKLWDAEDFVTSVIKTGKIVKIMGKVTSWQNQKQITINKYRPVSESDNINLEDYVPTAPISGEILFDNVLEYIAKIDNIQIKQLVGRIIELKKEKMLYYPAAKSNHHSIRSGLLYHIYRMLQLGEKITSIYKNVDKDLVYAGIILHDICKIDEMDSDELGIVKDYTTEGFMLGHITMGIKLIDRVSRELNLDAELSLLIQHMILSHHYEADFGSPKKPMIPEAELLHYIDMIDARMYDFEKAVKDTSSGEFTEPIWSLDRRRIYKPKYKE